VEKYGKADVSCSPKALGKSDKRIGI